MSRNGILGVIIVVMLIVLLLTAMMHPPIPGEGYCNCSGMASSFNKAPYTFWRDDEFPYPYEADPGFNWSCGAMSQHGKKWRKNSEMPFVGESRMGGAMRMKDAYGLSSDAMRDLYRDKIDGMMGTSTGCSTPPMSATGFGNYPGMVPLSVLNASLPPGSVSENRVRFGDGKFVEFSPPGNERFGGRGCNSNRNCDMSVGVL